MVKQFCNLIGWLGALVTMPDVESHYSYVAIRFLDFPSCSPTTNTETAGLNMHANWILAVTFSLCKCKIAIETW